MPKVFIESAGYDKLETIKFLKPLLEIGLRETKDIVDNVSKDNPQEIADTTSGIAQLIKTDLTKLGVRVILVETVEV